MRQRHDFLNVPAGKLGLSKFWRPKVTVYCRLFHLGSGKTSKEFSVIRKLPWAEFISRQITWQAMIGLYPAFDANDLRRLLFLACHEMLDKLRKAI